MDGCRWPLQATTADIRFIQSAKLTVTQALAGTVGMMSSLDTDCVFNAAFMPLQPSCRCSLTRALTQPTRQLLSEAGLSKWSLVLGLTATVPLAWPLLSQSPGTVES